LKQLSSHRPDRGIVWSDGSALERVRRLAHYALLVNREHHDRARLGMSGLMRALRFAVRGAIWWSATSRWLAFIDTTPLAQAPDAVKKVLAEKIHRPFARAHYRVDDRVALLMHHYRQLMRKIPSQGLAKIVSGSRIELVRLGGRGDDARYTVWLGRKKNFAAQGELSISFDDDRLGRPLATLAANVYLDGQGARVFYISGLQGPVPPYGKPEIVHATRSLSGLRPKRAVMEAARIVAAWLEADAIVAVGKSNHVTSTAGRRGRDIRAEYDEFWLEFAGVRGLDGDFHLPGRWPNRTADEVPAKRRTNWRRRHEHIDAIAHGTATALAALEGHGPSLAPLDAVTEAAGDVRQAFPA
jgi:uncharacterized protein VirK/YbjX